MRLRTLAVAVVAALAGTATAVVVSSASTPLQYAQAEQPLLSSALVSLTNVAKYVQNTGAKKSLANAQNDVAGAASDNNAEIQGLTPTPATTPTTPTPIGGLYVSASAASGGNGTQGAPFQTISQCATVVTAGNTCWVESGTYTDRNVCPASGATIAAYPGDSPVMNGNGASADAFLCDNRSNIRISGITIENYAPPAVDGADGSGAISFFNGPGDEADHNTISNISSPAQDAGIFVYNTSGTTAPATILDNQVTGVTCAGCGLGEQDGIWVAEGDYYTGTLVQGNVVSGAGKDGIRLECGTHTSTITVQDNIATHNAADGIQVNFCYATSQVLVRNNFAGFNTIDNLLAKHSSNATIENNTSVQPTTGVTDCSGFKCLNGNDGMQILGEVPFNSTGGYPPGNADGGNWNLTVKNNIFYGGGTGIQIGSGDYAVIKANGGVINQDDWFDWSYYMGYVDEHVTGDGGYDYFNTLGAFTASTGFEANGQSVNPGFVNPAAGNYVSALSIGADPTQLTGVGPAGVAGLSNTGT